MATTFGHINIVVRDIDATIAFSRLLGLDEPDAFEWPPGSGARHVEVKVQEAGHQVGQRPHDAFFGSRYAIVVDPDGNEVGLKSPEEGERGYVPQV